MADQLPGAIETLGPLVRRLLAPNPSSFTSSGTQSYVVGRGRVAVIDPGPAIPEHLDAILAALSGETVTAIVCTHTHRDHSPAGRALAAATGAPIVGCAMLAPFADDTPADESFDFDYAPDRVLADGERLEGEGWTLEAVATPGHTSNHLCFALPQAHALFSGDHVMGWSTSIVSPPDGDMAAYVASLEKLLGRGERVYYPGHGDAVADPRERVRALIAHRRAREAAIVLRLRAGDRRAPDMVRSIYTDVDPDLHEAAERSVLAHLIDLEARGLASRDGDRWSS